MILQDFAKAIGAGLSEGVRKPNVHNYKPNPGGQITFHKSEAVGRLLAGSNRSGKSVAGIIEDIWFATGTHPYQKTPEPPIFGRIITVDFEYGAEQIIEPLLSQWTTPSMLVNGSWEDSYQRRKHLLTFRNGSKIEIKAHGQALESFAGTPRDFLHVDEECPRSIFIESKTRLLDRNGRYWITMTPVEGLTWINEDFIEKESKNIRVFHINVKDNPHVSEAALQTLADDLSEEEQEIRIGGAFIPRGGLVLKEFDVDRHLIEPGTPSKQWRWYISIDHGYNNPTAVLWHAVAPNGFVVTFFEHYMAEWTVKMHAQRIKAINKELDNDVYLVVGDPSMAQRNAVTGHSILNEYRMNGVPIVAGKKHTDNVHLDRMNDYLHRDMYAITKNCVNWVREAKKYHWMTYESAKISDRNNKREVPQAKDDHAMDSTGYFMRFMPDLAPGMKGSVPILTKTQTEPGLYPWQVDTGLLVPHRDLNMELDFGEVE